MKSVVFAIEFKIPSFTLGHLFAVTEYLHTVLGDDAKVMMTGKRSVLTVEPDPKTWFYAYTDEERTRLASQIEHDLSDASDGKVVVHVLTNPEERAQEQK